MSKKILILGAGFGGLELSSRLVDALGDQIEITLIDKNDGFVFGFSKFDLMLGHALLPEVTFYYRDIAKSSVDFRHEVVLSIDPEQRRVRTNKNNYDADILIVALGAGYNINATPGFAEDGHEFYSVQGAIALKDVLPTLKAGSLVIGIIGQPFKCPPAPCEAAILLDEFYEERGVRDDIEITVVSQWGVPIPPSPDGSKAILSKFEERNITFMTERVITSLNPDKSVAVFADGGSIPYDLFLGIPIHVVPDVVQSSGLAVDGWIPVNDKNMATKFAGVYAIGDVTSAPVPKSGVFAESAAKAVADHLIAEINQTDDAAPFDGKGSCYVEFGGQLVARMDHDFFPGAQPSATFVGPSEVVAREKEEFVTIRRERWLGP